MGRWQQNEEGNSWKNSGGGWSGNNWGNKSSAWGGKNDSSSWGSRDRSGDSGGWHAKEDMEDKPSVDQKRSWTDGDEIAAKRPRWGDEERKEEVKQDSSTPRMPMTPVGAGGTSIPARMPMTPVGATASSTPARMPMTPVGAGATSAPARMPMTPVGAGATSTPARMPMTPVGAGMPSQQPPAGMPSQPGRMPMTPVGAGMPPQPGRMPMTPVGAGVQSQPSRMPMTPVGAVSNMVSRPSAGLPPSIPGTPGMMQVMPPGTAVPPPDMPSVNRFMVTPARAENVMLPAMPMQPEDYPLTPVDTGLELQLQPYQPKLDIFGDGREVFLKYAPRRRRGTGEKLPAPGTKVNKPAHWTTVAAGRKDVQQKAVVADAVPLFDQWRKTRRKEGARIVGTRKPGEKEPAAPSKDFQAARKFSGAKAGMVFKLGSLGLGYYKDHAAPPKEEPVLRQMHSATDMTPMMGAPRMGEGETPRFPAGLETPRLPGVETPGFGLGGETPLPGGDMTPRVPADTVWTKEAGDSTPIPSIAGFGKAKESLTPMGRADDTPMLPALGAETPMLPMGADTPMLPQGADTPMLPHQGADTPMLPHQGAETPRLPPQGGETPLMRAGASGDTTPMAYESGSMTPQAARAGRSRTT